ncbi:kynureninase [Nocardioides sp. R1-1]|uniref:kynureninase n=1 Tax=Nocardioides sp. R1-1 TaxID=3383502 RepID=UPI0038D067AD
MTDTAIGRDDCLQWDEQDPLRRFRERFTLPPGVIYLDGNSLGALPAHTPERVETMIRREWGDGLIRSWNDAGWFEKPVVLGDRIAPLIGAGAGEVVVGDSTSISLFQALTAAVRLRPDRRVVVAEADNFPTDLYLLQSVQEIAGLELRLVDPRTPGASLDDLLDEQVGVVLLSQVNYRTGELLDMAETTARVHAAGALVVWDLCHSVGALPVDVTAAGADFAAGCTYKYLNGGPGSPSFVYVAPRHQEAAAPPLTGWQGHRRPFAFEGAYAAGEGATRFRIGTPQLISMAALEASLDIWEEVSLADIRTKSLALTDMFIRLVEERLPGLGTVVTPRAHASRGSQVSVRVDDGYPMMQALIERGVIGDFRAPDIMRFGFTPLYTSMTDVWDAVEVLQEIVVSESWRALPAAPSGQVT